MFVLRYCCVVRFGKLNDDDIFACRVTVCLVRLISASLLVSVSRLKMLICLCICGVGGLYQLPYLYICLFVHVFLMLNNC